MAQLRLIGTTLEPVSLIIALEHDPLHPEKGTEFRAHTRDVNHHLRDANTVTYIGAMGDLLPDDVQRVVEAYLYGATADGFLRVMRRQHKLAQAYAENLVGGTR